MIDGTKYYISGVEDATGLLVMARTGEGSGGRGGSAHVHARRRRPGLAAGGDPDRRSRPRDTYTVFFDGVAVGEDRVIGGDRRRAAVGFDGLNPERILAAAMCTGVAATRWTRRRATPTSAWCGTGRSASTRASRIRSPSAKIALEASRLMTSKAALLQDAGAPAGEASNMAKLMGADNGLRCLDQAIQTHGGNGLAREYGLADLWFIVRLLRIAPVSREMILNYVAQHSLGLPRSY